MTTLLNNTSSVASSVAAASPSTQKQSAEVVANLTSCPSLNLPLTSASLLTMTLPQIVSLGHKTCTPLPTMFDDDNNDVYLSHEFLKRSLPDEKNASASKRTDGLRTLRSSRICEITLDLLDSMLLNSHLEYKEELLLDNMTSLENTLFRCQCDDDIDEDLLSQGDIEDYDVDDEVDDLGLDGPLPTPITVAIDYEMPLVDIATSTSRHRHHQESIYRREILLDCVDDILNHTSIFPRGHATLDEDELSQGDIESDYESDDHFSLETWSDLNHTMDRGIVEIPPSSE